MKRFGFIDIIFDLIYATFTTNIAILWGNEVTKLIVAETRSTLDIIQCICFSLMLIVVSRNDVKLLLNFV